MTQRAIAVCAILLISGLLIGCGTSESPVLAVVGDDQITVEEFEEFATRYRSPYQSAQDEFVRKRAYLDTLIDIRILVQAAYQTDLENAEIVDQVVEVNRQRFLLEALYQNTIATKTDVTAAEIREFYDNLEYQVRASHILVNSEDSANMLLESLREGANFDQLAYENSADPSAKRTRGDLGYFTYGSMVPEFDAVAFSLEVGEISPPVETQFGYHIIKLVDKQLNQQRNTFPKMRVQLKRQLLAEKRNQKTEEYFEELRGKYPIKVDKTVCDHILNKRLDLYPPNLLGTIPKSDFDEEQLDRHEKELVIGSWEGGQITLIDYLLLIRKVLPLEVRPDFDDLDSLQRAVFELEKQNMLVYEANQSGVENTDMFKRKIALFREYSMADIYRHDSIQYTNEATEQERRDYYDQNRGEFTNNAKVHVYEILINDELTARKLAREIRSLDQFKEKASELTERSGMRAKMGDLGYIEEKWYPDIFPVAWETEDGSIGGPVPSRGKYSIVYPVDRIEKTYSDFLDVKDLIGARIGKQQEDSLYADWIQERRTETDIQVFEQALRDTIDKSGYGDATTEISGTS